MGTDGDTGPIRAAEQLIRDFQSIAAAHDGGLPHQLKCVLELGCERLGMEIGIVSRVEGDQYHVVQACTPNLSVVAGDKFELGSTYCVHTLSADGPVGFAHVAESDICDHPCYAAFGLETYLGVPLRTPDGVFGTLNFSSPTPREGDFDLVDIHAVQLMGTWISGELMRAELADRIARLERHISMCAGCHQVRTELGDWMSLESYFKDRTGVEFTHGMCPDCEKSGGWP